MDSRIAQVLQATPIFRKLSADDRARLAPHVRIRDFVRGDQIFAEGSPSDRFYAIASGRVKVFKMTPAGKDVILEIFGVGAARALSPPGSGPRHLRSAASCAGGRARVLAVTLRLQSLRPGFSRAKGDSGEMASDTA